MVYILVTGPARQTVPAASSDRSTANLLLSKRQGDAKPAPYLVQVHWKASQSSLWSIKIKSGLLCCPVHDTQVSRLRTFVLVLEQHVAEDEYGALVERYWKGKSEHSKKIPSQRQSFHHKHHMDRLGIEPGLPQWEAAEWPPDSRHGPYMDGHSSE